MTELAEKVGLSTTPVTERVKRLERDNFITGYHARLNPNLLGKGLLIFVELKLRSKSGNIFEDFRREVMRIPQILECHLVSGEYDYLIKVRLPICRPIGICWAIFCCTCLLRRKAEVMW